MLLIANKYNRLILTSAKTELLEYGITPHDNKAKINEIIGAKINIIKFA